MILITFIPFASISHKEKLGLYSDVTLGIELIFVRRPTVLSVCEILPRALARSTMHQIKV